MEVMNITTKTIRTLYDLGEGYYNATKDMEEKEFFDLFREYDENGFLIEGSEIDFEALGQGVFDYNPSIPGEFIGTSYKSGGHEVFEGFTWFQDAFNDEFWKAIENYYSK